MSCKELIVFMRSRASELGLMKKGITEWATEVFKQADADGSDELSVIEDRFYLDAFHTRF